MTRYGGIAKNEVFHNRKSHNPENFDTWCEINMAKLRKNAK